MMPPLNPEFRSSLLDSGFPPFEALAEALESTAPSTAIRLNPRKPGAAIPQGARPVPWHPRAFLLPERPDFTLDPAMHQGAYYVQDPSSMFIAEILRQLLPDLPPRPRVLDLCAAPGGKTTAMADVIPDGSLLVSNEYDFRRAEILKENVIKWGYPWCVVTRGDTARFRDLPDYFDLVAVDAPCSGEGMTRKDPQAREQWSPALVARCATLQAEILDNAAATLRPGGYLVYSTCTFNTAENERQTERLLASGAFEPVAISTNPAWNILAEAPLSGLNPKPATLGQFPSLRFLPGRVEGEGYTVAILRKTGDAPSATAAGRKQGKNGKEGSRKSSAASQKLPEAELLARVPASLRPRVASIREGEVAAIPEAIYAPFQELSRSLEIIHAGVTVAEIKGRDYLPTQSLAMLASPNRFPTFEVDKATALDYLRRQALSLPSEAPKGYILLTHRPSPAAAPLPLGFAKNLGSRANNLYPASWRILRR